jgi:hypothetical protein
MQRKTSDFGQLHQNSKATRQGVMDYLLSIDPLFSMLGRTALSAFLASTDASLRLRSLNGVLSKAAIEIFLRSVGVECDRGRDADARALDAEKEGRSGVEELDADAWDGNVASCEVNRPKPIFSRMCSRRASSSSLSSSRLV